MPGGAKILIIKCDGFFFGNLLGSFDYQFMLLIRANQQSAGKGLKPHFSGSPSRLSQPHLIAVFTTTARATPNLTEKLIQQIAFVDQQRQLFNFGKFFQRVQSTDKFPVRVNIGIEIESGHIMARFPQQGKRRNGAGPATNMQ